MSFVGGHVSVSGGLIKGIEKARIIGARTIQIFGSSPRQWACRLPSAEVIEAFNKAKLNSDVKTVYLHAPYLVNLGTPDNEHWLKSIKVLIEHLQICEAIKAEGLVFHIGSFNATTRQAGFKRVIDAIKMIFEHANGESQLIMENSAGGPNKIGSSLEDLGHISKKIKSSRLKVCFDTAHAFESGLIDEYTSEKVKILFDKFEKLIGIDKLVVLHINDSKTAFNSHHDRHENIGKGHIGLAGFKNLAQETRINELPWILEVPGFDESGPDKKNIKILESCFN